MRITVFVLTVAIVTASFISQLALAAPKNYFPLGKVGASTYYTAQTKCELVEGQECIDVTGVDVETHKIENVTEDDLDRPIFESPQNKEDCADFPSCVALGGSKTCLAPRTFHFDKKENWPLLYPAAGPDEWFAYCQDQTPTSYVQKVVRKPVEDPVLKAAKDAAQAAAASDKATRDSKRATRVSDLQQCNTDLQGAATLPEVRACVLGLVRQLMEDDLATGDL